MSTNSIHQQQETDASADSITANDSAEDNEQTGFDRSAFDRHVDAENASKNLSENASEHTPEQEQGPVGLENFEPADEADRDVADSDLGAGSTELEDEDEPDAVVHNVVRTPLPDTYDSEAHDEDVRSDELPDTPYSGVDPLTTPAAVGAHAEIDAPLDPVHGTVKEPFTTAKPDLATESGTDAEPGIVGSSSTGTSTSTNGTDAEYDAAPATDPGSGGGPIPLPLPDPDAARTVIAPEQSAAFRARLHEIRASFIDDPRQSSLDADTLLAEVARTFSANLDERLGALESDTARGDWPETEDLRVAMRQNLSLFDTLLDR